MITPKETQAGSGSWFGPGRQEQQEQFQEERVRLAAPQEQVQEEQPQKKKCKWYQKCNLKKIVNAFKPSNIIKTVVETTKAAVRGVKEGVSNFVEFLRHPSATTAKRLVRSIVNTATGVAQVGFGTLFGSDSIFQSKNDTEII